jgi:hypothetical protein
MQFWKIYSFERKKADDETDETLKSLLLLKCGDIL